jgi:hypothetical protein
LRILLQRHFALVARHLQAGEHLLQDGGQRLQTPVEILAAPGLDACQVEQLVDQVDEDAGLLDT